MIFKKLVRRFFGEDFGGLSVLPNVVFALSVYFDSGKLGKKRFPKEDN